MNRHRSSGLATVLTDLVREGCTVLDLGPMSSGTTTAFLNKRCKCYVEDIVEYINTVDQDDAGAISQLDEHLLPKPDQVRFDVILCWDVFNYLSQSIVEHLMSRLEPYLKKGTILHMMRYVGSRRPDSPQDFRLLDDFTFELRQDEEKSYIRTEPLSTVQLLKRLNKFSLRNNIMNQQGMQQDMTEMLLEYDTKESQKHVYGSNKTETVSYFSADNQQVVELPVLKALLTRLKNGSIFDAGRKMGRMVDGLNTVSEHLYVEDVFSSISWQAKLSGTGMGGISDYVLKFDESTRFDVVLTWDLFNYCHPEQISRLIYLLKNNIKPGSFLHLILLNYGNLPSYPITFNVTSDLTFHYTGQIKGERDRQFASTAQLLKMIPDFSLVAHKMGSFGSGEGYHEFLLKHQPK